MADFTLIKANPSQGEITSSLTGSTGDGAGLHFDGSAGNIDIASPPDLGTAFSFEFVVKADSWGGAGNYLLDFHSSSTRFVFGGISTNADNLGVYTPSTFSNFAVKVLDDLKVHHLVLTVDGTTAKLYDNGNQVGSTLTLTGSNQIDAATTLNIGKDTQATTRNLDGTIYRARFWNKTLSSTEVQTAFERADVDYADQYGSQTETSTNSFTNVGFAGFSGSATGFTSTGSANGNSAYKNQTFTGGKKYRITFTVTDGESASNIFALRTGSNGSGANTGNYVSYNKGSLSEGDYPQLAIDETGDYEIVVDGLGSASSLRYAAIADLGAVDISGFSIVQIGCVSDYQTQWANPSQSLTVQDASGSADGTCSASGVTQVQPVVQLNSTSARIGTTAATPADGDIIADKVGVGAAPVNKLSINGYDSTATLGTDVDVHIEGGGSGANYLTQLGFGFNLQNTAWKPPVIIGSKTTSTGGQTEADFLVATRSGTTGTDAPTTRLIIDSSGNVGIACDPANPLQVEKASAATSISNAQNDNALKLSNYSTAADGQFVSLGLSVAGTSGATADSVIAGYRDGAGNSSLRFYTESGNTLGERMRIDSSGNCNFNGNLYLKSGGSAYGELGLIGGNDLRLRTYGSSGWLDVLTVENDTGLATFSGDTKIGDGLVANYVKHVAGLDATVAISFTFPSQSARYIHQMLELRVAMGDDGAATATPTFLRYAFTTLTTASGITQMDASLGAGITASTGASGTTFTVTLTEGSAISMDNVTVFATVTSGHADAKCTGMTVA